MLSEQYFSFISNLDIYPSDIVNINVLTLTLKIISQYDVRQVMTLQIKTITPVSVIQLGTGHWTFVHLFLKLT